MKGTVRGEGRQRNKKERSNLRLRASFKTGNVNNTKYTKQTKKEKEKGKVSWQINYAICRGNQLFLLLNLLSFLLRIKETSFP
jgi:hypothetical protein